MSGREPVFSDRRLDLVCTRIQQTGTAVDLPEVLQAAAERIGLTDYTMEFQGVMLYRLRAANSHSQEDA